MAIKKIIAASLAVLGFLALAACAEGDPNAAPPPDQPGAAEQPAQPLD